MKYESNLNKILPAILWLLHLYAPRCLCVYVCVMCLCVSVHLCVEVGTVPEFVITNSLIRATN